MTLTRSLGAAFVLAAFGLSAGPVPSSVAATATKSVTAQVGYECNGEAAGAPSDKDTVSIQMLLTVPTSVAPGETVSLRGTLKMQFSEKLRQRAKAFGVDEIDAVSTNISTYRTLGGQASHFTANRWQSGPTPIRNPMEVSGALSFPAFKVPTNASGELKLQMPQNGAADTNVNSGPKKVALSVAMAISGPAAKFDATLACYLPRTNPAVIVTIPISSNKPGQQNPTGGGTTTNNGGGATTPPPATSGSGAPATSNSQPVTQNPGTVSGGPSAPAVQQPTTTGTVTGTQLAANPTAGDPENGIYVSTSALVLGGFAVVMASLGYAALTNARLRNIQRSLKD